MRLTAVSENGTKLTVIMEGEEITLVRDKSGAKEFNPFTYGTSPVLYGDSITFKNGKLHLFDRERWIYSSGPLVG